VIPLSPVLNFYELPNNTTGGAAIPILGTPTPLAILTASTEINTAIALRATVGWMAQANGINITRVIFKIWRGAPVTGSLVVSVEDSGESNFDNNKVTTFGGIDFGFTGAQDVTYVLTAELTDAGAAARAIGGLTFTTIRYDLVIPDRKFFFTVLPNNTVGGAAIPVTTATVPLVSLLTRVKANDSVFIGATIGWVAQSGIPNVLFKIWRGAPFTGKLVVSVLDNGETFYDNNKVTAFGGVDTGFTSDQDVDYVLTAETTAPGTLALIVGAMTMTGTRYPQNSPGFSFYALPDNTADSVIIPITTSPQPIALLNIEVSTSSEVVLMGTVGWKNTSQAATPKASVIYKLWRGAPNTGSLIFSVNDSADVERNKVTSFAQVDTGFSASQNVTYILTAELTDPTKSANVIGALTLTAVTPEP